MTRPLLSVLVFAVVAAACARTPDRARSERCFDVVATDNSPATREVFRARQCQGGGVTWAGIVGVLARRRGTSAVVIDDEGDAARICTDSARLTDDLRGDVKRLNANRAELERAIAEADPLAVECGPMQAVAPFPEPTPPPAEARARETSLVRLRAALAKQRTWCWGPGGAAFGAKGSLTFDADGTVIENGARGTWSYEEDGRIEVRTPTGLHHFDVGDAGLLGFNHSKGREDLHPCQAR